MPGFTIHIIIAKEYIKKHPNEIKNEKDFIRGSISPDLTTNKNKTHYGTWEKYILITHLNRMLKDPEVDMKQDYWKGYFYHLYVDNRFYHEYFAEEWEEVVKNNDRLFNDYYLLNKDLIKDYKIDIGDYSDDIREKMTPVNRNELPKYIKYSKLKNMIKELSEINIDEEVENIRKES